MEAAIAQLGERQTEDLKVPGSIPGLGTFLIFGVWGALHVLLHAAAHVALQGAALGTWCGGWVRR